MKPTAGDILILNAFRVGGAMTAPEAAAQLRCEKDSTRSACERLYSNHFLNRDIVGSGKPAIYTLAAKGRRHLERQIPAEMGDMPQPRTHFSSEVYVPKAIHTREGSGAFLQCPSRRGDELHAHRLPISMAGGEG